MSTDLTLWLAATALAAVAVGALTVAAWFAWAATLTLARIFRDAWARTRADHLQRVIADAHCDYTPTDRPDEWARVADTWEDR